MNHCTLCPRNCGANRSAGEAGYCGVAGRGHLRGPGGPAPVGGTLYFRGNRFGHRLFSAAARCGASTAKNHQIARAEVGRSISVERLAEIFLELAGQGAANINLVTPTPLHPRDHPGGGAGQETGTLPPHRLQLRRL